MPYTVVCAATHRCFPRLNVPALPIEWLIGPVAALALALVIGRELWRAHREADKREQDRADALDARLDKLADAIAAGLKQADPK